MERAALSELGFESRQEALAFLKRLWRGEGAPCPLCGQALLPLHKKATRSDCDWRCKGCDKTFKTIHLLDEINARSW